MMKRTWIGLTAAVLAACGAAHGLRADEAGVVAQAGSMPADAGVAAAAGDMARAAQHYLASLTEDQKQKGTYEWSSEERVNWHFIPRARKGLPMKEMRPEQQRLATALLASGLSQRGFVNAETIMSLERILLDIEKGSGPTRDPELYYVTVFGKPADRETWGWRVEGHHLSLNFTIVKGKSISSTPLFMGTNPHVVREGPRAGLRVLDREEDLGLELVKSLDGDSRKTAIILEKAPAEIITGNARTVDLQKTPPAGLSAKSMNDKQKATLARLVATYAERNRPEVAREDLQEIAKAGWDNVTFAWAGETEAGHPSYYRVQGPTFLLEYDNTQNNANHVHTVWRDPKNDFGDDLLRDHYDQTRGDKAHGHDQK